MTWLVDGHVHYQDCFGWPPFLRGALGNLDRIAHRRPEVPVHAGCLLFVDVAGTSSLDDLEEFQARARGSSGGEWPADWTLEPTDEPAALRLRRAGGPPLLLVRGRQVATREGLEVLAIGTTAIIADGAELEATVRASLEAGAITVIPWGFGKWWLGRGRTVARVVEGELGASIHLGDNGNRAALGGEPELFARARQRGMSILPGSDPLPLRHHVRRALSFGFLLEGALDPQRPVASLRARLGDGAAGTRTFGELRGLPLFVVDQLSMQVHARRRARGGAPTSPQPRIEER